MTTTISFEVTVERHEPSGAFVARCINFPRKSGIGLTEDEAVADLKRRLPEPFLQPLPPHPPGTDPWAILPGLYPNDELTQEWEQLVRERRDVYDDTEPARGG